MPKAGNKGRDIGQPIMALVSHEHPGRATSSRSAVGVTVAQIIRRSNNWAMQACATRPTHRLRAPSAAGRALCSGCTRRWETERSSGE